MFIFVYKHAYLPEISELISTYESDFLRETETFESLLFLLFMKFEGAVHKTEQSEIRRSCFQMEIMFLNINQWRWWAADWLPQK